MSFVYLLFEITLLIFPLIGLHVTRFISASVLKTYLRYAVGFILLHNIFYFAGYSIKGDYFDYVIFSIEYLLLFISVTVLRKLYKNIYIKILNITVHIILLAGYAVAVPGIVLFIVLQQDYSCERAFIYKSNGKTFETRRYVTGFATWDSTTFSFDTYRTFSYLPVEKAIDKSTFFDTKTPVDLSSDLNFKIEEKNGQETLIISSPKGGTITKKLE